MDSKIFHMGWYRELFVADGYWWDSCFRKKKLWKLNQGHFPNYNWSTEQRFNKVRGNIVSRGKIVNASTVAELFACFVYRARLFVLSMSQLELPTRTLHQTRESAEGVDTKWARPTRGYQRPMYSSKYISYNYKNKVDFLRSTVSGNYFGHDKCSCTKLASVRKVIPDVIKPE